jgi:hypothetical protein
VPFTVVAGTDYAVSAPADGSLARKDRHYSFRTAASETERELSLPKTATSTTPLVPFDVEVAKGTPLVTVHDSALTLRAELTPAQVLRIGGRIPKQTRAEIDGSTGPFDCTLDDPRPTAADDGTYAIFCQLPRKVPAVVGATGVLALPLAEARNALVLPVEAVAGSRQNGLVYLKHNPEDPRPVALGVTDGAYIQIITGVKKDDIVLIPSPTLLSNE